jgi:hypothetical protein
VIKTSQLSSLLFLLIILAACGSNLDISGRGARTSCFYLLTDSMKIKYECDDRKIFSISVSETINGKDSLYFKTVLDQSVKEYTLPVERSVLENKTIEIGMQITNTHWREAYYIFLKPGDLKEKERVSSRYFGH